MTKHVADCDAEQAPERVVGSGQSGSFYDLPDAHAAAGSTLGGPKCVGQREIARRLDVNSKIVRRIICKVEAGATCPACTSPGSKLDLYNERIVVLAAGGRTAWNVYVALHEDLDFSASYELVKKHVAKIRRTEPRGGNEPPGAPSGSGD